MTPHAPHPAAVTHRPDAQAFEATVDGHRCAIEYHLDGATLTLHHTFVPPSLEGRGIAAQLVVAALGWARSSGLKVNPTCSYVRVYLARRREWADLQA